MVEYKCIRCKKTFNHKCRYEDHLNRKIPCEIKKDEHYEIPNENYCEICDRYFSRPDTLKKHIKSKIHKEQLGKQVNKNQDGIQIINNGDYNKNKVIINKHYHFISPFANEEIDQLTPEEKLAIFASDTNPIIIIIIKTNLNPSTIKYHNVDYKNMNLGWGYIFNGETWEKKEIQAIMNDLLNSKRKDLLKIYEEIKEYLSEEQNKDIANQINEIDRKVEPRTEYDARSKKRLVFNLKIKFTDNQHLINEAIKKSGKPIIDKYNIKTNKIGLKEGYTMEEVIKQMNIKKKEQTKRINIKKAIARNILDELNEINNKEHQLIAALIENTTNIDILNTIIRLLNKTYCFGDTCNKNVLDNEIRKDDKASKIIFNNEK